MRRAPAKPVRACTLRKLCPASHVTCESPLRTSHFSLQSSHSALHTSHSTLHTALLRLHTSHFTLHTSHSTLHTSHCTLRTPNFTLHSPHFTVHTSHFSLLTAFFTLTTSHFTLHSSRPTLHTALFTLHTSSHLSPSHLIPAHLFSSLLICHLSFHESLPSTTTNHCRSLDAATPIRFTIFSCKIQEYYDLRSAAKYKSITYAAAAPSNLDAAIPMRSAETQLQKPFTIELRATASETAAPKPDLDAKAKKRRF